MNQSHTTKALHTRRNLPGWLSLCALALLFGARNLESQSRPGPAGAEIVFLDVGQGDAILIRSDTFNVLIDAGRATWTVDILHSLGVDHINLLIATHNHFDHIGGMDAVIDSLPVGLLIDNGCQESTEAQAYVENAVRNRKVVWRTAWDTTYTLVRANLRILPSPFYTPACDSSQNNLSVGVLIDVGNFRALLTGDSERYEEIAWIQAGQIPKVTLLKAAHHGARNGVTPGWIQATKPSIVVISVGANNTYGHPEEEAMRYYRLRGRRVLRTDHDGTIGICIEPAGKYEFRTHLLEINPICH